MASFRAYLGRVNQNLKAEQGPMTFIYHRGSRMKK